VAERTTEVWWHKRARTSSSSYSYSSSSSSSTPALVSRCLLEVGVHVGHGAEKDADDVLAARFGLVCDLTNLLVCLGGELLKVRLDVGRVLRAERRLAMIHERVSSCERESESVSA